jgi:hypothetical protein
VQLEHDEREAPGDVGRVEIGAGMGIDPDDAVVGRIGCPGIAATAPATTRSRLAGGVPSGTTAASTWPCSNSSICSWNNQGLVGRGATTIRLGQVHHCHRVFRYSTKARRSSGCKNLPITPGFFLSSLNS